MVTAYHERNLRVSVFVVNDVDVGCSELPLTLGVIHAPICVVDFHVVVVLKMSVMDALPPLFVIVLLVGVVRLENTCG